MKPLLKNPNGYFIIGRDDIPIGNLNLDFLEILVTLYPFGSREDSNGKILKILEL